jgi:two-component system, sensor histidine kinase and response regulator
METASDESRTLRRTMRDLVALSALPAVWAGCRPLQVAEGLADVLLRALRLDLVYIRLPGQTEGQEIEVARTAGGSTSTDQTRDIGRALASWLDDAAIDSAPPLPNPVGPGTVRLVAVPIGCGRPDGVLVAGSRRTAFPGEEDRLLLSVGANQAAAVLQRERDEEALRESEERYRSVITAMQEGVVLLGADGCIRACNASAERILGLSAEQIMGRTTFDPRWQAIHEDGSAFPGETHPVTVTLRTGRPCSNVVMGVRKPSGELTWISINSQPLLRGNEPTPYAVVASFSDITERKNTEEALRESEHRWRSLAEALPQLVWTARPDGFMDYGSAQIVQYMGRPEGELLGWGWVEMLHPEDRERTRQAWRAAAEGQSEYEIEHRFRRFDGTYRWFKTRGVAIRNSEGDVYKWFGTCTDITTDKQAEEALRASEQRFRTFVDHASDAFFLQDDGGVILDVNRQACESLGYTREELLGRTPVHFDPDVTPAMLEELDRKLNAGETIAFESRHRRKDGTTFPVEVRGRAFWENDQRFLVSLARDVTERKRAEEALRESEGRFRGTFENAAVGIAHTHPTGRLLRVNEKFCAVVGYPREELLHKTFQDITHPDDLAASIDSLTALLRGESSALEHEKRYLRKDGSPVWVELFTSLQRDAAGQPAYAIAVVQDISERKRLEEALREGEHRWRSLTEALPQLVWTATPDGSCDYFSTQWTQHTGVPQSELLGWRWLETLHPDDRERTRRAWTAAVQGPAAYDVEYRVGRADGIYRWFKTRGLPIRDSEGNVVKWFGTCTDITDLRRTEEALRESEERFRGTFENAAVGIAHVDVNGRFLRVNEKLCDILGYTREELLARKFQDITFPEDLKADLEHLAPLLRGEVPSFSRDERYLRKDGSIVWVAVSVSLQRDAAGRPLYTIPVTRDISHRKRLETEFRHAREVAEAANRAKDEFLANVSHEIRTPMNAILGMTELVLDTPLAEDQRQGLKTVKSAAYNLLGIINDLLDFSKIEAGKLELDPANFSLRAALGDTLRALAGRAHQKGLELIYQVQPDVPDALVGDAGRLRQVLLNLVGNAVKFTDDGEVVVRVEVAGDPAPEGEVGLRFTVRDTGIGIPKDRQESIFRAFEQEDTSTTRKYGGTGLGLTIAARLVALMAGRITVDSEPGRGSTFAFTARFGRQPHPPGQLAVRPPALPHGLPVLVVDDNATNRRILEEWLRGWQMKPVAVADGAAALDALWHAAACGRPYALVLLDARMPDADGLALAAQIRKRAELSATRIILLTSGDRPGDLARLRELRVDAHLLKPVQQDELLETIYRVMSRANGGAPPAAGPAGEGEQTRAPAPAARPLRILVAEDNEFNAQLLEQLLGRRGHRVRLANNGREALALAGEGGFDLLLLDVHMPELDGFQVAQAVRERERTAGGHLPIIALTARSRKEDRERCLAAGMDDFLAKPIQAADLWAAIDRVVGVRAPADRPGTGLLDPQVLLAVCGGDAAILEKICQAFRDRLPDHLKAVQGALRDRDAPRLREAAHKLSGMVAAFSSAAGGVASELEDQAAQGRLEEARPLVARLEAMAQELLQVVCRLSLETLRRQTGPPRGPGQTAGP